MASKSKSKHKAWGGLQATAHSAYAAEQAARRYVEERVDEITANVSKDYTAMALLVLHDEFGFGLKRLQRVYCRLCDMADSLNGRYLTFQDIRQTLIEEVGFDIEKEQVQRRKGDARWSPVRQPERGKKVRGVESVGGGGEDRSAGTATEV